MASNGGGLFILYKVVNDENDEGFNAFRFQGAKPTLGSIKAQSAGLYKTHPLGPEGYHWRVFVEDKHPQEEGPTFSWWDIQDENASLPIKQASQYSLSKFFGPGKPPEDAATKAAKGAFKSIGKAMSQAVGAEQDYGPPVQVIAFKLLDLVKMTDEFTQKRGGTGMPTASTMSRPQAPPAPRQQPRPTPTPAARSPAPQQQRQPQRQPQQQSQRRPAPQQQRRAQPAAQASLMDFGPAPAAAPRANESRAEKLKREYAQKASTAQRVWDDVDQRWVEKPQPQRPKKKEVGISLDASNAHGKSAKVQQAVQERVNDMKQSQAKALQEIREREDKKKRDEAEEDTVRKRLEPKIKAWSEEHGKKKQLRALLASLHTILWPGAKWKQVTIGDLLDDKKVKLNFHKASRVVHPDKTMDLDAERRFLAKRIFDSLSQAKAEFDAGKK